MIPTRCLLAARLLAATLILPAVPAALAAGNPPQKAMGSGAAPAPASREALIEEGRKAAFFCANCHGETGVSKYSEVPNLAAQNATYLLKQIDAFGTGARKNDFMQGLVKVLNTRERNAIAVFYANAPVTPSLAQPGALAARGAELYAKHCARCHQPDALGAETFPRLAGQQTEYLRLSLTRYLKQTGERLYTPMTAAVMQLGEANIPVVIEYLAGLR